MNQITLALNSYRSQVAQRLLEIDVENNRPSIGIAAEKIGLEAETSVKAIENYFSANSKAN